MQPTFNPWLGYFDMIDYVDKFIFLDTVQLTRRSWQVRNKLKVNSKEYMFTLPILKEKKRDEEIIDSVKLLESNQTKEKLYKLIQNNYKKSKFYNEVDDFIKKIIFYETDLLSPYNINIITEISSKFNLNTEFISLSNTDYQMTVAKGNLILDICKYFNVTDYISPLGSKEYLENVRYKFEKKDITINYQYFKHPLYHQLGDDFIPYLGIFDLLYNEGFENSIKIIRSGRKYENR
jgi:hypothetical protein